MFQVKQGQKEIPTWNSSGWNDNPIHEKTQQTSAQQSTQQTLKEKNRKSNWNMQKTHSKTTPKVILANVVSLHKFWINETVLFTVMHSSRKSPTTLMAR